MGQDNFNPPLTPEQTKLYENHVAAHIEPVLSKWGAKIVARDYNDVSDALKIEFQDKTFSLGKVEVGAPPDRLKGKLTFLLSNFDQIDKLAVDFAASHTSPFYSDIYRAVKNAYPHGKYYGMAYDRVVYRLREAGIRIWS